MNKSLVKGLICLMLLGIFTGREAVASSIIDVTVSPSDKVKAGDVLTVKIKTDNGRYEADPRLTSKEALPGFQKIDSNNYKVYGSPPDYLLIQVDTTDWLAGTHVILAQMGYSGKQTEKAFTITIDASSSEEMITHKEDSDVSTPDKVQEVESSRVKFDKNRLTVDGKPFFFFGTDGVTESLTSMKSHHFNTIYLWDPDRKIYLIQEASSQGLMVIPGLPGNNWSEKYTKFVKEVASEPSILAWAVGDDLNSWDMELVRLSQQLIRGVDPHNRPMMLDVWGAYLSAYSNFTEMLSEYIYPLMHPKPLSQYKEFLMAARSDIGMDRFFWTFVQAHMQTWYCKEILGTKGQGEVWGPSAAPDAEQIRLLTYLSLASGVKGIIYFQYPSFFREDWHGKDRYAEAGILGCELEVVGPLLAEGEVAVGEARFDQSDVNVSAIRVGSGMLIFLTKLGEGYQYQIDEAEVKPGILKISSMNGKDLRACQLAFPQVQQLDKRTREGDPVEFSVPEFDLATVVLVTSDRHLLEKVENQFKSLLTECVQFTLQASEGKREKVRTILNELGALGVLPATINEVFQRGDSQLEKARALAKSEDFVSSYQSARQSQKIYRSIQHQLWDNARNDERLQSQGQILNFYLLPMYYRKMKSFEGMVETENLLPNSSFEVKGGEGIPAQWAGLKDSEYGKLNLTTISKTGKLSCHFISKEMPFYKGAQADWVSIEMNNTEAIPVKQGEIVLLEVWVNVPEQIRHTRRGALLQIRGYDSSGKPMQTGRWEGIEGEQGQFLKTDGWYKLQFRKGIIEPEVTAVRVRLGLSGVGECFFDDISLKKLIPQGELK